MEYKHLFRNLAKQRVLSDYRTRMTPSQRKHILEKYEEMNLAEGFDQSADDERIAKIINDCSEIEPHVLSMIDTLSKEKKERLEREEKKEKELTIAYSPVRSVTSGVTLESMKVMSMHNLCAFTKLSSLTEQESLYDFDMKIMDSEPVVVEIPIMETQGNTLRALEFYREHISRTGGRSADFKFSMNNIRDFFGKGRLLNKKEREYICRLITDFSCTNNLLGSRKPKNSELDLISRYVNGKVKQSHLLNLREDSSASVMMNVLLGLASSSGNTMLQDGGDEFLFVFDTELHNQQSPMLMQTDVGELYFSILLFNVGCFKGLGLARYISSDVPNMINSSMFVFLCGEFSKHVIF